MLILEAMKMENEIEAPADGTIIQIRAAGNIRKCRGCPRHTPVSDLLWGRFSKVEGTALSAILGSNLIPYEKYKNRSLFLLT